MEEFGSIEEDYTEIYKKPCFIEENYEALLCEPGWFLTSKERKSDNQLMSIKYGADYLYMKGMYLEAINLYKKYINECINLSLTVKRECLEGVSRSYLSLSCCCYALHYAYELQKLVSTSESYTACLSLLYDCCFVVERYRDSILYCQKLVLLHPSSSDTWLKLCFVLSKFYNIPLLFVKPAEKFIKSNNGAPICKASNYSLTCKCEYHELSKSNKIELSLEKRTLHLVTSLLYVEFHIKSVMFTTLGFALVRNIKLQRNIQDEVKNIGLNKDSLEEIRESIKKIFTDVKSETDNSEDFVDGGISKVSNKEQVKNITENVDEEKFENFWFLFNRAT